MPDKVEAQVDRYAYGKNRPGNASVAYVAETQLRDIKKTLPLRVLSQDDWKHWTTRGYVVVKQAVPPENVKRLVDLLWKFQEMNPADPNTWYKGQLRDHAMKELNNSGMVEIYNHQCLWDNRQHPRVYDAFVDIWDNEKLWVTIDRANLNPPNRSERPFGGFIHWDADTSLINPNNPVPPGLLGDKTFREGFAVLGRLGLSFDALVLHPQLNDVANLAGAFPDTKIVLNHVGRLVGIGAYAGKLSEQFPRWAASIKALAAHENVHVKVGGLGQAVNGLGFEKQAEPPSSEMVANAMRPYVETCIEAFGARRCMFESNFPPDKEGFSYPVYWNACKRLTSGASGTERADLFAGTAARFYRLNGIG